ncbi:uncharacterized protein LOC126763153 isoform X1 [Bactrocera neohumeralis]|uniref:uncharacterized protein LOC126763153 isoform X1 n=1 Tax=Bactrocera neohumeralis TaxID=98809 RepID=UPI0021663264|nr:uncharacterized protein LOC126763153 isoform X1 [Bactrocera neohumeralis]
MAKLGNIDTTGIGGVSGSSAGGLLTTSHDDGLFAMLACVGVFICMISTLVGIKIWWFKHRLTFDHSRTSNGAAGGATPTLPLRTRSSREKRMSQEIREPVEVHGVFRRRQEDDLDIVPTKQLPPVRIRNLSQSTPSLFPLPPTRRQERVRSAIFEEYEPPTREPPRPPIDSPPPPKREPTRSQIDSPPLQHTPTISLVEEMPTFDELEEKYRQMELNEAKENELNTEGGDASILRVRESPPLPPKRLYRNSSKEASNAPAVGMHKFVKAKSPSLDTVGTLQNLSERRATGYLRPDEVDINVRLAEVQDLKAMRAHSVEEFGERRPTGYIKYEEIDTDGLDDFRNKWDSLQTNLGAESPISNESYDRTTFETMHGHNYDHLNRVSACELSTVADSAPATFKDVGRGANTAARFSWQTDEHLANKQVRPESQASIDFTSDEEYAEELDGFKPQTIMKSATVADSTFGGYESVEQVRPQTPEVAYAPTRVVKFANAELGEHETLLSHTLEEEKDTLKMRRPTGYVRTVKPEELWDEMEANIKQDEREKHLWLEIEKDVNLNRDFASNIEEEFDKIRHSYEENEAAFLEGNNSLKRVPKQVLITTPEPEGFGKSIDEDWASFENLSDDKSKKDAGKEAGKQVVQFKLSDLEDAYDKESVLRTERRPTAFVRNTKQIQRELSNIDDEDEQAATTPHYQTSTVEFVDEANESATKSLKERRPTGYVRPQISDLDEDYVHEHNKDSIFEPVEEPLTVQTEAPVRPRTRQKVTFDFSNTEYFQTPPDSEEQQALTSFSTSKFAGNDSDITGEDETAAHNFPKPMQRITKIHYIAESVNDGSNITQDEALARTISPTPVPLLFGTQVSLEQAETEINDNWAAIRQRRQITTTSPQQTLTPILINADEPPKPAYRNPLAQASTVQSVTLMEERVVTQQQMSTFQPHAAARHQYFEQSYYNSTEA